MDTLDKLTAIFKEIFLDDSIVLTLATTANDIDGWDSFAHLNIIMAVENVFNLEISDEAVPSLRNIGDMIALIENTPSRNILEV